MGISRTQFRRLPEDEQLDALAYEVYREEQLTYLMQTLRESKYADGSALMQLILERL